MYMWNARKHAWNDGTAANVQGAVADHGRFALLFRSTQSNHISHLQCKDFIVPTSCTTNTPPSPIPSSNIPQNSSKLVQLHSGPLRSCKKIGGEAAVQQSCSKQARRNPSPKIKVTVHEETRGQWKKRPNSATAHAQSRQRGEQTTSRSSALVQGRSTQFIANPCRWPQRPCPKRGYISAIFPPFSSLTNLGQEYHVIWNRMHYKGCVIVASKPYVRSTRGTNWEWWRRWFLLLLVKK